MGHIGQGVEQTGDDYSAFRQTVDGAEAHAHPIDRGA